MSHGGDDGLAEEHEEHVNHEAWVIPYADLLTLLMAMFIALFAMSSVDIDKFKSLSIGFNEALGGGELATGVFDPDNGGDGPLDGQGSGVAPQPGGTAGIDKQPVSNAVLAKLLENYSDLEAEKSVERQSLGDVAEKIQAEAVAGGFIGNLQLRMEDGGLRVIVTDQVLFDSGQAELRPDGLAILNVVGNALKPLDNAIVIEGHTDSDPIGPNGYYTSNWQLSTDRAVAVALYFNETVGLDGPRITPSGRSDWDPVDTNATSEGKAKNRRVEIVVQSNLRQKTLEANGLGDNPVAAAEDPIEKPVDTRVDGGIDLPVPNLADDH